MAKQRDVRHHVRHSDVAVRVDDCVAGRRDGKQVRDVDADCDRKHQVQRVETHAVRLAASQPSRLSKQVAAVLTAKGSIAAAT